MDALKIISEGSIKAEKPQFNVGDTVRARFLLAILLTN